MPSKAYRESDTFYLRTVAKAALRRKKNYEHQLEQTSAQMLTVEREISSIETANINKETLDAMKNAQAAMKKIHGGLTIDKVDQTMEDLREQHAIGEEIAEALTQGNVGQGVDEDELDEELAELQQEELDNKMLKTGSVPVSDQIQRLPNVGTGESEFHPPCCGYHEKSCMLTVCFVQSRASSKGWKRTTRKRSCGNYRRRWRCDPGVPPMLRYGLGVPGACQRSHPLPLSGLTKLSSVQFSLLR